MSTLLLLAFISTVSLFGWLSSRRRSRRPPVPPGPPGYPLIGNVRDINRSEPGKHAWEIYADLAKDYDEGLLYLEVLKQPVIIINSAKAAMELLEKRSSNYSDRPVSLMVNELMGWEWDFAFLQYSDRWRLHRKTFHQFFQPRVMPSYYPIIQAANITFLQNLLVSPDRFVGHVRSHPASIIVKIMYDYDLKPENDLYVKLAEDAMDGVTQAITPGSFLVDFLPVLKYVPAWFPGAGFQRKAIVWKKASHATRDIPYERAKEKISQGKASNSFVARSLDRLHADNDEYLEEVIKNCAGVGYLGGADTTVSTMLSFILAIVLDECILKKAHAELDAVVGATRLPNFDDRPNLPYMEAIFLEALRWIPVTPLGIPHKSVHDDIYEGYLIPGGSIVIANSWAMLHNPEMYPEPSRFNPERWLPKEGTAPPTHPANFAFGFGRRICPGRYLILNTAWMAMVGMLAVFNIKKAKDEAGNDIVPVVDCNEVTICHPLPFKCSITPRSPAAASLIARGYE